MQLSKMNRPLAIWLLAFIASAYVVGGIFPPARDIALDPEAIQPESGKAFVFLVPRVGIKGLLNFESDSHTAKKSTALLYENGVELGPAHVIQDSIRQLGQGRYSHRGRRLYFSSSDGTSPLSNGRRYTLRVHLVLSPLLQFLGALAAALVIWRVICRLPAVAQKRIRGVLEATLLPTAGFSRLTTSTILLIASTASALLLLFYAWKTSRTVDFAIGSLFQVSDASNYVDCANRILDRSISGPLKDSVGEWCSRRVMYPTFLATIMAITGRNWTITLLLQGALLGWAIGFAATTISRTVGFLAAAGALCYQLSFAKDLVLGTTLTENAGLLFGSIGAALLFDGARRESKVIQLLGIALLSIALNARAGAFFVLPFMVIWAYTATRGSNIQRVRGALLIALVAASGFLLQGLLVKAYGGILGASHSNFAYTLYGLSVGGKSWGQISLDHPELFQKGYSDAQLAAAIFALAKENVLDAPILFLKVLGSGVLRYLRSPMFELQATDLFGLQAAAWWVGAIVTAYRWREPEYRLIALLNVGIALSAPFIIHDVGPRVFAATWPITVIQASIGLSAVGRIFGSAIAGIQDGQLPSPPPGKILAMAASIGLFLALFIPLVTPGKWQAAVVKKTLGCESNDGEVVTRLGKESYSIALLPQNTGEDIWKSEVDYGQLKRGFVGKWIETGFDAVMPPTTIIRGYQLADTQAVPFGTIVPLVAEENLGPLVGKTVSICFTTMQTTRFADVDYYAVKSIRALDP